MRDGTTNIGAEPSHALIMRTAPRRFAPVLGSRNQVHFIISTSLRRGLV